MAKPQPPAGKGPARAPAFQKAVRAEPAVKAKPHAAPAGKPATPAANTDLPPLGQSGASLLTKSPKGVDPQAAQLALEHQELQRIAALPSGHPELERYKKPEALRAQTPEGAGASGKTNTGGASQTPPQADAQVGADSQQISSVPAGDAVAVQAVVPYLQPPSTPAVDSAVAHATAQQGKPAAPQAAPAAAVAAATSTAGPEVAPAEPAAVAEAPQVADTALEVPTALGAEAAPAGAEPAPAPTIDAAAVAGAPAPVAQAPASSVAEAAPAPVVTAIPEAMNAAPAPAPAGPQVADAKEAVFAPAAGTSPATMTAEPAAVPAVATAAPAPVQALALDAAAPASAGQAETTPGVAPAATASPAPAPASAVPTATAAPQAAPTPQPAPQSASPLPVPAGRAPAAASAQTLDAPTPVTPGPVPAATGPAIPALAAAITAPGPALPAVLGQGLASVPAAADVAELVGAVGSDLAGLATAATGPTATASSGAERADLMDVDGGGGQAAPKPLRQPDGPQIGQQTAPVLAADAVPVALDRNDPSAGQEAATVLGLPAASAGVADLLSAAKQAVQAQDPAAQEAIAAVAQHAGLDPAALLAEAETAQAALAAAEQGVAGVAGQVQEVLGQGAALPGHLRQKAEQSLGVDLSQVRLHQGQAAETLADAVGARAFATGQDVVLGTAAELAPTDRDAVLAEELVHVVQQGGQTASQRGAMGVSQATDRAEVAARAAARQVLQGARVLAGATEVERRALFRSASTTAPSPQAAPQMPTQVEVTLAGQRFTITLPQLAPGTTQRSVALPAMTIPGLKFERSARLRFDATTGQFAGGTAYARVALGQTVQQDNIAVRIAQSGEMQADFANANLTVGTLLREPIAARVGPNGVVASGNYAYSRLQGAKLQQWLRSGSLSVEVDSAGAVTAGGALGLEVAPLSAGTLQAQVQEGQLTGQVQVHNTNTVALAPGKAELTTGDLSGHLQAGEQLTLQGQLGVVVTPLPGSTGTAQVGLDTATGQFAGDVSVQTTTEAPWGPFRLQSAQLTGTIAATALPELSGQGTAQFAELFGGQWQGKLDLATETVTATLGGQLIAPLVRGEVTVQGGALTLGIEANALKSLSGNADFALGNFLSGTAALLPETTQTDIHATATAALVAPLRADDALLSAGQVTLAVHGPTVQIEAGQVALQYRDAADGTLELTPSEDVRQLSGTGTATLRPGQVWGDLQVVSGSIAIDVQRNRVEQALGDATFAYKSLAEGQLSFDARKDFSEVTGTAAATLTADVPLTAPLVLKADPGKTFALGIKNSTFDQFSGQFAWQYEQFRGDVTTTGPSRDWQLVSGSGKADLLADLPIGTLGQTQLMGKPGSDLTGVLQDGQFVGVTGDLAWSYDGFLAGKAQISQPRQTIREIDGVLQATVIAAKALPGNPRVVVQPGEADALTVELRGSVPTRYRGTLGYQYEQWLQGTVAVAGELLDFSTLAGTSSAKVIAPKQLAGAKLLPGSQLQVDFADSAFDAFHGDVKFEHDSWLTGRGTSEEAMGSALSTGLAIQGAQGTLKTDLPGNDPGGLQVKRGGKLQFDVTPGLPVSVFKSGSEAKVQYQDWLAARVVLDTDSPLRTLSGTAAAEIRKDKALGPEPTVTMLPGKGLEATFAAGIPVRFGGAVQARLQDWLQGSLAIAPTSGSQSFDGTLTGKLLAARVLGGTGTTLQPGGEVSAKVQANQAVSLGGVLAFSHGQGAPWLAGTVSAAATTGTGLDHIDGQAVAEVQTSKRLGDLQIDVGGALQMPMVQSQLPALGGDLQFRYGDGGWLAGALHLGEGSTQNLVQGRYDAAVTAKHLIGVGLHVLPSAAVQGAVQGSQLQTMGGEVNWQLGDWLSGTATAPQASPEQLSGSGAAQIAAEKAIIPGKLWMLPGGDLQATLQSGSLQQLRGQVPFRYQDWATGTVTLTQGDGATLAGAAELTVTAPGKRIGDGGRPVQLLPGGTLQAQLDASGLRDINGEALVEVGSPGGESLHVRGNAGLRQTQPSTFHGDVTGGLTSPLRLPPALTILPGGNLRFAMDGAVISQPAGEVTYQLLRGGQPFLQGQLALDASSTATSLSGSVTGTVQQAQRFGVVEVLPGGQVAGTLTGNNRATLGGQLAANIGPTLRGSLQVDGQFDPDGGQLQGQASADLIAPVQLGALTLEPGSQLGAAVEAGQLREVWGQLAMTADPLRGRLNVPRGSGSTLTDVSGQAEVGLSREVAVAGSDLHLTPASGLQANIEHNTIANVSGQLAFRYQDWLVGQVSAEAASLDAVTGGATAQLSAEKAITPALKLLPGGNLQAQLQAGQLGPMSGEVSWQYGDGEPWLQGTLAVQSQQSWESLSGQASARVLQDAQVAPELILLAEGSGLEVTLAGSDVTALQGGVQVVYGSDQWLRGQLALAPQSTPAALTGTLQATAQDNHDLTPDLTVQAGSSAQAEVVANDLTRLTGNLTVQYGEGERWLQGQLLVADASTPDQITGQLDASLIANKRLSDQVLLEQGGAVHAAVAGGQLQRLSGQVTALYSTWLQGQITLQDSDLESVDGTLAGTLTAERPLAGDVVLRRGGNLQATLQSSEVTAVQGQVDWRYAEWLQGQLAMEADAELALSGRGTAELAQQKRIGNGQLELQRGGGLQVAFANNALTEASGQLGWRYADWLEGQVALASGSQLLTPSGTADARLYADKALGADAVLRRGGALQAVLAQGQVTQISGAAELRYADWLSGKVELTPSAPAGPWTGAAELAVLQRHQVTNDLAVERGGRLAVQMDSAQPLANQPIAGELSVLLQDWLAGRVQVQEGSRLGQLTGQADVSLRTDKQLGEWTLRRGGNLHGDLQANRLSGISGALNWQYQDWLAGTLQVQAAADLTQPSGRATATLLTDKSLGPDITLLPGGRADVQVASGQLVGLGGALQARYQQLAQGEVTATTSGRPEALSGAASMQLLAPLAVAGSELQLQPGGRIDAQLQSGQLTGVQGQLAFAYASWLRGRLEARAPKLDGPYSGEAHAGVVTEQPIAGSDLTVLPGGSLTATVASNKLTALGGQLSVRYQDLAEGTLALQGAASLQQASGQADLRLIRDLAVGADVQILRGSQLQGTVQAGKLTALSGKARVQYSDWLQGTVDLQGTRLDQIHGQLTAAVMADHSPGGGVTLQRGGRLQGQLQEARLGDVSGELNWQYAQGAVQLDGRMTVQPSPLTALRGEATARLLADTPAVAGTRLLVGGNLQVTVVAGKPESLQGRAEFAHEDWLGGAVELQAATKLAGPFRGQAEARLLADKALGDKWTLQQGGRLNLTVDTAQNLTETTVSGELGVAYDQWLQGRLELAPTASLRSLQGAAELLLLADKSVGNGDVTLLAGGNLQATVAASGITGLGGLALLDYQQWLRGSIQLQHGATLDHVSGRATVGVTAAKDLGRLQLQPGGQVYAQMAASQVTDVNGVVDATYDGWLQGQLQMEAGSTWQSVSGQAVLVTTQDKQLPGDWTLLQRSNLRGRLQAGELGPVAGEVHARYQDWLQAGVTLAPTTTLQSLTGTGHIRTLQDKALGGDVVLKAQSSAQGTLQDSKVTGLSGTVGFVWRDVVAGQVGLNPGSTLTQLQGRATFGLLLDQPLGLGLNLKQGGSATADLTQQGITQVQGQLAIGYEDWAQGQIRADAGSTLQSVSGGADLSLTAPKTVGPVVLLPPSQLAADVRANQVTEFRGNVEVTLDDWLRGNLQFKGPTLQTVSGTASVQAIADKRLVGPLSLLQGSHLRATVQDSQLQDFGGTAGLAVDGWGQGQATVDAGSTLQAVSGRGQLDINQPRPLGSLVTLTRGVLGAELQQSQLQHVWGEAHGQVKGLGEGWLRLDKSSTTDTFDGQAGVALTQPLAIGRFAELSGGEVIGNFSQNALTDFGGWAQINVHGWGSGRVELDAGSKLDHIKGTARLSLNQRHPLAGGKVQILGGEVSATVDGQSLTHLAGSLEAELTGIARGRLQGEVDLQRQVVSGQGQLQQLRDWQAGPARIHSGQLTATVSENRLVGAAGSAQIDAGRYGQGQFTVNMEDVGDKPVFYGTGTVAFQPHDRVQGTLAIHLSRDQQLTGEGDVAIRISDKITGRAGVALDAQGHVKLRGGVEIPGPFEIFAPRPYRKDIKLLDLSFLVYAPPAVKLKVGAGMGLEVGIKPLTLSNLSLGGEVDLMDPGLASMAVSGQMSSSAYADISAYVEGSVQVSAAVVAVQAGLRAALNLHLEAAISARPTLRVDRNGLAFDMPVDARLTAALNLILTFFAKVRVGLDVGLFSIMKTVWQYEKQPDPLRLAEMSIGAKGRVRAAGGGFQASMNPEYRPPNLSLESLKRALRL